METESTRAEQKTMTFDEVSMERSKSFVTALQELKNLRPQLDSAAEYCEKSYLNSEQNQTVLDNVKDYAVRALVNAIDHLGTVAYKLNDILEQQTLEVSSIDLKLTCLNQKLLTCQTYTDREGLRQQQLLAIIPRHHKHYTLPSKIKVVLSLVNSSPFLSLSLYCPLADPKLDSANKKVHFSPHMQSDSRHRIQVRGHLYPSGVSAAKTLSWHLASETKSTLIGSSLGIMSTEESNTNGKTSGEFNSIGLQKPNWEPLFWFMKEVDDKYSSCMHAHLCKTHIVCQVDAKENSRMRSAPATRVAMQTLGVTRRDSFEGSRALTPHRSFNNPAQKEVFRAPIRAKSMLSGFFNKQKTSNLGKKSA